MEHVSPARRCILLVEFHRLIDCLNLGGHLTARAGLFAAKFGQGSDSLVFLAMGEEPSGGLDGERDEDKEHDGLWSAVSGRYARESPARRSAPSIQFCPSRSRMPGTCQLPNWASAIPEFGERDVHAGHGNHGSQQSSAEPTKRGRSHLGRVDGDRVLDIADYGQS